MRTLIVSLLAILAAGLLYAQSSKNVIVVPANQAAAPATAPKSGAVDFSTALQGALRTLQEMKATNEDTLRKQAAALQQLDEMEAAADQLRIYAKRG